jgi:hypothetical protein
MRRTRRASSKTRHALGIAVVLGCISTTARDARADFDFQFATSVSGGWLRQTPTFTSKAVSTSARDIAEGPLATKRSLAMVGVGADVDLTLDDRWKVPLFGGNLWWTVGSYDANITGLDGSIARVRPWSTFRGDILLPGVGRCWKHRRNMWAAAIRTGVSFATMRGSVAAGTETVPLELIAATFLVQAELEGCRRLDPTTRVCLQIVPRLYEHELLNGVTFGLRMEWGR